MRFRYKNARERIRCAVCGKLFRIGQCGYRCCRDCRNEEIFRPGLTRAR